MLNHFMMCLKANVVVDGTYQNDWVVKSDVKRGSDEVVMFMWLFSHLRGRQKSVDNSNLLT